MNRRHRILIVALTIPAILALFCLAVWQYGNRTAAITLRQDKESFEAQILQSLPPGSNKVRVQQFLDSRHMTYVDTEPILDKTAPEKGVTSVIEATSRDRIEVLLGSCSISAKFRFDSRGVLLGHTDWHSCKWVW